MPHALMFPSFLPESVKQLTEPSSIALAQKIQRRAIATPFHPHPLNTAYVKAGKGNPPILLLHGFDSSVLEFRRLLPMLAAHHETWAVDLLGFGFSDRLEELTYAPKTLKSHLYAVWKTLINQPVILVGASMGGAAAIDLTLNYPEAVHKLVLINSVGFTGSFVIGSYLLPPLDSIAVEFWRQRKLQSLLWSSFGLANSTIVDAIRCAALHLEMPLWSQALASFMASGGYIDLAPRISQIQHPTLILWGERDDVLGTADANKFRQAISHSKLVWLPMAGHVPQWEKPQAVAQQIFEFAKDMG